MKKRLVLLLAALACDSSTAPLEPVFAVSITTPQTTLVVGQTTQLSALPISSQGAVLPDRDIVWSSSSESVARVSTSGLVTAAGPGSVTIFAESEGIRGEAPLTVTPVPINAIAVAGPSGPLPAGTTATLTATAMDAAGAVLTGREFTWTSSDDKVARVSPAGVVTALMPGAATITASSGGKFGTLTVNVVAGPPASIVITPQSPVMYPGSTRLFAASIRDAAGNVLPSATVTWASENETRATVDQSGVVSSRSVPGTVRITAVSGSASGFADLLVTPIARITLGDYHGCSLAADGTAFCWGRNINGELGTGSAIRDTALSPRRTAGGHRFTSLSAGGSHTCGITQPGTVYCWGANSEGQLGDGTRSERNTPQPVVIAMSFKEITAGTTHTCGVNTADEIYCWGMGALIPTRVPAEVKLTQITAGNGFTCGLDSAGAAYCWGSNGSGQLGNGSTTFSTTPQAVIGGNSFTMLDATGLAVCGIAADNQPWCWGQLRWNDFAGRVTPERPPGDLRFTTLSVSDSHTCGLTPEKRAWCIGFPGDGEMGNGIRYGFEAPGVSTLKNFVQVAPGVANVTQLESVSVGWGSSCAIDNAGRPFCWGYWARIGVGSDAVQWLPVMQAFPQ